jgi:hypothetical protein
MVYFALVLSDNAIHFRCNAAAALGLLPRGGRTRRNCSHASGSLLYTSSFLDHYTLIKQNLAIGLMAISASKYTANGKAQGQVWM